MNNPNPLASPALLSLEPGDPDYAALAELAVAEARAALGRDVELDPESVDRSGRWAFVRGRLHDAGGTALSLQGTPFEDAANAGAVSGHAAVLLRQDLNAEEDAGEDAGGWTVVDRAVLPTDVAWLDWPSRHGAPSQLLGLS